MTTNKFDTSTYRLAPRQRGEGVRFESVGFDLLIGGKLTAKDPQISTVAAAGHTGQVTYFATNTSDAIQIVLFARKIFVLR